MARRLRRLHPRPYDYLPASVERAAGLYPAPALVALPSYEQASAWCGLNCLYWQDGEDHCHQNQANCPYYRGSR